MKILFVCENYHPHYGGAEVLFKNLAEGLVKKGNSVAIITTKLPGTKSYEEINGVKVHRVNCFNNRYLFSFLSIPKVLKLAKKADIIQTTTFNGAPPAWLGAKLTHKPVILTVHEVWVGKWKEVTGFSEIRATLHDLLERALYL
ncbi:MAG: glycosyltransferase, partial [Nanoarchaeota archaeon]